MVKLSAIQIKNVRSYLCKRGSGFKNCSDCPFFLKSKECNKRRNIFPKDEIQEIANAWEVIKEAK